MKLTSKLAAGISPVLLALTPAAAVAQQADGHAPAGVMFEHIHEAGEFMVGYHVQRMVQDGSYYRGSEKIGAANGEQALGDYSMLAKNHQMLMHMLHLMYAPSDQVTLSLMPMYMTMDMDMQANPYQTGTGMHHGHGGMHGGMHVAHANHGDHGVSGLGDTLLAATYRAYESAPHQLLTTLAISAPTGDFSETGADGKPVHYGMQPGAGVWQVQPSITYQYHVDPLTAGVQLSTRQPLSKTNNLGFYIGDQVASTAWLSYLWNPAISTSVRLQYEKTDTVQGHYEVAHNHSSPADFQANYGGERIFAGFGVNTIIPGLSGLRVGAEYLTPLNESLNGVGQRTSEVINLSISRSF